MRIGPPPRCRWHHCALGPTGGDAIVVGDDAAADLDGRHRETLSWAQLVVSHSADGWSGVNEDRVAAPSLLSLFDRSKCLVDGEDLGVENLLVRPQLETATSPPLLGPPDARRSYPAVVLSRAVCPDGVRAAPVTRGEATISVMLIRGQKALLRKDLFCVPLACFSDIDSTSPCQLVMGVTVEYVGGTVV